MKTLNKALFLLVASGLIIFSSCKEDKKEDPKPEEISITINTPEENATYGKNDTVFVTGSIEGPEELHGYMIEIINTSHSDSVVFEKHQHDHGTSFQIDEMWINNVSHHSDMQLKVTVYPGHEGDEKIETFHFHCHPM
ncbi:hypothetical protein GYB29_07575 [bacterium]|nr:hypothetical protein [bacterium]